MSTENDSDVTREEGIETVYPRASHVDVLGAGASIASTIRKTFAKMPLKLYDEQSLPEANRRETRRRVRG